MVVKIYTKASKGVPAEAETLKTLSQHGSVINILTYLPNSSALQGGAAFFEYCPEGDLFDLRVVLRKKRVVFSEKSLWPIIGQLSAAIAFLHEGIGCDNPANSDSWHPVIHRDIKPENVFIVSLGQKEDLSSIVIKPGDFGFSAFYDSTNARMPGWAGTTMMWPPEQTWEGHEARPSGDVWAVGCVVHELAHGFPPVVNPDVAEKAWGMENRSLMAPLHLRLEKRATAGQLQAKVEEWHAAFLFEELKAEHEAPRNEEKGTDGEDGQEEGF
ncbi:kinase-like protein [Bimuria novae-zelandiae CBS 107.79]|uniref:non-specific serine/threonine protein kinase n=1 Tax=Bimuria novae-zelandiae CBS 107.79 TaxID=1447943 RepID=A0A6A5VPW5_9PLEO|nr:kinase-like protein [Bimuria novae-zelandiae CBS 107.79]